MNLTRQLFWRVLILQILLDAQQKALYFFHLASWMEDNRMEQKVSGFINLEA